ncbi:HEAT repeat domain-containing protein [Arenibacter certesii]|uniref:HEAT repeat domain-containing protein n=1 Tax=Arenibacter certesii TaxID=228955 RepID=A0A918J5F6_9FLAO|nr:HEAT repeat domain-containing protein [Arenibacter certesii]GGW45268.1 hypothetical protein GCM10007383_32010 [Arenibacter certesii]
MKLNTHNYKEILTALSLPEFWEDQLSMNDVNTNSIALRMLHGIKENITGGVISRRIQTDNKDIRKFAKSMYLEIDSTDAFKFLEDDFDRDFNALDELRIHSALKKRHHQKPLPPIIQWVNMAQKIEFKIFLIKEIGLFQQMDSAPQLLELYLQKVDYSIKAQIVDTLGMLGYEKAVPIFIESFNQNPQEVKDKIIDAFGKLGGEQALRFLENVYYQTYNKETLVKILRNIRSIDHDGRVYAKLENSVSTEFEKIAISYIEQDTAEIYEQ